MTSTMKGGKLNSQKTVSNTKPSCSTQIGFAIRLEYSSCLVYFSAKLVQKVMSFFWITYHNTNGDRDGIYLEKVKAFVKDLLLTVS